MKDAIFCFTCIKAFEQSLISSKNEEKALISVEYKNWSNAATSEKSFHKHNRSEAHREAHQCIQVIPGQYEDFGEQISQPHAEEKSNNQQVLLKILSNVVSWISNHCHFVGMVIGVIPISQSYTFSEKKTT